MTILFKNAYVITMDNEKIMTNAYLVVCDGKITYLSENEPDNEKFDRVIDCKNKLIMPGLINAHTHIPMTLMRGYGDGLPLEKWLNDKIFPIEDKMEKEDFYWSSLLANAEMISTGTTAFNDMYFSTSYIADAVEQSKMRAVLYCCGTCFEDDVDFEKFNKTIDTRNLKEKYKVNDRISIGVSPHAIYTCTDEYLKFCGVEAKRLDVVLHTHLSETQTEFDNSIKKNGVTPTKHLENLGVLSHLTIAAHGVFLTDDDVRILKENNVTIAHNPTSNLKLGSGICDIKKLVDNGINVTIGTDGASSNNNLNMFEELHIASILNCGAHKTANVIEPIKYLEMATLNAAKALRFNNTGVIKEGYTADLIVIDLDKPHLYPIHDIVSLVLYSVQGSDVCLTMVGGDILYENGEYNTIDIEKVKFEVSKICKKLFGEF